MRWGLYGYRTQGVASPKALRQEFAWHLNKQTNKQNCKEMRTTGAMQVGKEIGELQDTENEDLKTIARTLS